MSDLLPENWMQDYRSNLLPLLTAERIAFIRSLRCDKHESWRGVSQACLDAWPDVKAVYVDEYAHQPIGMALCTFAADHFGEQADQKPWNGP